MNMKVRFNRNTLKTFRQLDKIRLDLKKTNLYIYEDIANDKIIDVSRYLIDCKIDPLIIKHHTIIIEHEKEYETTCPHYFTSLNDHPRDIEIEYLNVNYKYFQNRKLSIDELRRLKFVKDQIMWVEEGFAYSGKMFDLLSLAESKRKAEE